MPQATKISIIIATYNWKEALAAALSTVLWQKVLPHEVIVADDGSRPDTAAVVAEFAKRSPIPIIHAWQEDDGFRLARVRNLGISRSTGDYLLFLDGDMLMHPHCIADHMRIAKQGQYVQGKRGFLSPKTTDTIIQQGKQRQRYFPWHINKRFHHSLRAPWLAAISMRTPPKSMGTLGCHMAAWREDVIAVNGFNEAFNGWGSEDVEFTLRLRNHGCQRQVARFMANCYHLHHPDVSRKQREDNRRILQQTIDGELSCCEQGLDKHLA